MANNRISPSKQKKTKEEKTQLSLQQLQLKIKKSSSLTPTKRNKCTGIQIVGNRIYDSENGKSCHQCRQKTRDFVAACKNRDSRNKPCKVKYCHKCLDNRYGELAEEMMKLDDWKCPKCRDICNCSRCKKGKGHLPNRILAPTAKKAGFSSVSEMLHHKVPETIEKVIEDYHTSPNEQTASSKEVIGNSAKDSHASPNEQIAPVKEANEKVVKDSHATPNEQAASSKVTIVYSRRKHNKENISSDQGDSNDKDKSAMANNDVILESKRLGKGKLKLDENKGKVKKIICDDHGPKKTNSEMKKMEEFSLNAGKRREKMHGSDFALLTGKETKMRNGDNAEPAEVKKDLTASRVRNWKKRVFSTCENARADVTLPEGNELTTVGGIELSVDDVGPALQFLEFCTAFGEVLDLKNGQPESVLREIMHGRAVRRGWYSSAVQFHIKLMSIIQKDLVEEGSLLDSTSGSRSWLKVLHKYISTSQCALKELPLDCTSWNTNEYEKLSSSRKLRVLNFLCDETLCTEDLRRQMDEENSKYMERKKEAHQEFLAAKEKVNHVKEEVRNEVTQAFLSKVDDGAITIGDNRDLLSKIKSETKNAQNKKLEEMNLLPKKIQRSDAIRTEPVHLDGKGQTYWRLRGYSNETCLLLQVIQNRGMHTPQEKWFIYDDEEEKVVEKYVSSSKRKRHSPHVTPDVIALEITNVSVKHDFGVSSSQNILEAVGQYRQLSYENMHRG